MEVKLKAGDSLNIPEGCKATIKDGSVVFEREFEDGDVLVNKNVIFIYRKQEAKEATYYVCTYAEEIRYGKTANNRYAGYINQARLATEEEKQLLFDKMEEQGLKWNAEEKRVEKIRWRAGYKCRYFYIDSFLNVVSSADFRYAEDEERWEAGNYFRTSEQAKEATKRMKEVLRNYHEEIGE